MGDYPTAPLPRAGSPEEAGVSSAEVLRFVEDLQKSGIENHSYMVLRGGRVAAEAFHEPFAPDLPHPMYSVSKTVTAIAVGFAIEEGLFALETRLLDLFPEYMPKSPDDPLWELTIFHLVAMQSGKEANFLDPKEKGDWVARFFASGWEGRPGRWKYVNENIYMLCAAIHRVTGASVTQFLMPRLYRPLGIQTPFWETDENGVEAGGWGLWLRTEDLAKIMLCYQQGCVFQGEQVIPAFWAKAAPQKQTDNSSSKGADTSAGYGFGLWRCKGEAHAYRADGLFSQFGIVFEDYDAVLVMTNAALDEQSVLDCIWRHFPKAFQEKTVEKSPPVPPELLEEAYPLDVVPVGIRSRMEERLEQSVIRVKRRRSLNLIHFPPSILPIAATYLKRDKAGNFDQILFAFSVDKCAMTWTEGDETNTVSCGMDGHQRYGKVVLGGISYTVCASAAWLDERTLEVWIRPLETVAKRTLRFHFDRLRVHIRPGSAPTIRELAGEMAIMATRLLHFRPFAAISKFFLRLFYPVLEPHMHGILIPRELVDTVQYKKKQVRDALAAREERKREED